MTRDQLRDPEQVLGERRVLEVVEVAPHLRRWVVVVPVDVPPACECIEGLVEPDDRVPDPSEVDDHGPSRDHGDGNREDVRSPGQPAPGWSVSVGWQHAAILTHAMLWA